ncbi:hypothetical protein Sjap_015286 [Stephania japonica]|uniref:X8 domain-containing protein n=1 Tax=Stephania japonica TaxID=461633 RepID=A0AAP0IIU9_9MAGN
MSTTDYACGAGADCEDIRPQGRCYHSDTMVPHAYYAFSDYWQTKKRIGATCDFRGTAMIISFDPRATDVLMGGEDDTWQTHENAVHSRENAESWDAHMSRSGWEGNCCVNSLDDVARCDWRR